LLSILKGLAQVGIVTAGKKAVFEYNDVLYEVMIISLLPDNADHTGLVAADTIIKLEESAKTKDTTEENFPLSFVPFSGTGHRLSD
jgi:hypothetical protein